MTMLHSMAMVKGLCGCKEGLQSVDCEFIKKEMIRVGLL